MTIEESLEKLEDVLEGLDIEEVRQYLSEQIRDGYACDQAALRFLYRMRKGVGVGLVPLIEAILEYFPIDNITRESLKKRLKETEIEDRLKECDRNIAEVDEEIAKVEAMNREAKAKMDELRMKQDDLKRKKDTGEDYRKRIDELEQIVGSLKTERMRMDMAAASSMGAIFDEPDILRNYEVFLSACLKGREMVLPDREGADSFESENARIIHEFMLVKWYLTNNIEYDDETFSARYAEIMKKISSVTEESKTFFRDYMDASQPEVEHQG